MAYATQESAQTDRGLTRPMTRTPYPGREGCTCHSRVDPPLETYLMLDSLLVPTAIVALAEIGDKTQLATMLFAAKGKASGWQVFLASSLALVLAAGIGVLAGEAISRVISPQTLKLIAGIGFVAIGAWTLYSAWKPA